MAHDSALERLANLLKQTLGVRAQQGFALNTPPEFSAPVSPRSIGGQSLNGKFVFPLSSKPINPPMRDGAMQPSPNFGALPAEDATAAQRGTPYAPPDVAAATANPSMVQTPAPAPAVAQLQAVIPDIVIPDISSSSAGPEYAGPMSSPRPGNLQPAGMDQMGLAEQLLARQQIANALNNPNGSFKSLFGLGG